MRRALLAIALLAAPLAGCIGTQDAPEPSVATQSAPSNATETSFATALEASECRSNCYEPTIATGADGTIYATGNQAEQIWASEDGGDAWDTRELPAIPIEVEDARRGDGIVQVGPENRLWYTALVSEQQYRQAGPALGYAFVTHGIQVATSTDGGQSWDTNTFLSGFGDGHAQANNADRQWLAIGEAGSAYLVYQHNPAAAFAYAGAAGQGATATTFHQTGLWAAHTSDAGESFTDPQRVKASEQEGYSAIGSPTVTDEGQLLLPAVRFPATTSSIAVYPPGPPASETVAGSSGVEVWRVNDDLSVESHTVLGTEDEYRAGWFAVADTLDDGYALAWWSDEASIHASYSADGGGWSDPVEVTDPGQGAARSPWVVAHDGSVDVVFAEPIAEDRSKLWVEELTVEDGDLVPGEQHAIAEGPEGFGNNPLNSEFAHATALSDGSLATTYSSGPDDGTLFVTVEE
jgi:hypothetical protein